MPWNGSRYIRKCCPILFQQVWLQVIYIKVFSVCILLVSFTLSHFKNSCLTLLQVLKSLSVVVNVRFVTNGMCVKNNTHVAWTSRNRLSTTWDLYCCMVPQCGALCTCSSVFLITTKWCFDQDVKVVPGTTFTKRCAMGAVHCKHEEMLLQPLVWRCIGSVVFVWSIHENDQSWTCTLIKSCDMLILFMDLDVIILA